MIGQRHAVAPQTLKDCLSSLRIVIHDLRMGETPEFAKADQTVSDIVDSIGCESLAKTGDILLTVIIGITSD
jgi:hypothetical protein